MVFSGNSEAQQLAASLSLLDPLSTPSTVSTLSPAVSTSVFRVTGEGVPQKKQRKQRSDKGVKRGPNTRDKGKQPAAAVDDPRAASTSASG